MRRKTPPTYSDVTAVVLRVIQNNVDNLHFVLVYKFHHFIQLGSLDASHEAQKSDKTSVDVKREYGQGVT